MCAQNLASRGGAGFLDLGGPNFGGTALGGGLGSGQSPQKLKKHCMTLSKRILCVTHGVKELSTRSLDVELRQRSVCSDVDATQLNSTSSCRHVHSVNNCHLSMNVVTQLTQFVGHDVINKNTTDLAVCCSTGSVGFKLFS